MTGTATGTARVGRVRQVAAGELRELSLPDLAAVVLLSRPPPGDGSGDGSGDTSTGPGGLPGILVAAATALGVPVTGSLRRGPAGRPYLEPPPRSPDPALDFNISHSGELVGIAVSAHGDLGLDVQELPGPGWERIAARWLHPDEWAVARPGPQDAGAREFTRSWAVREARCKATGLGLAGFRSPSAALGTAGHCDGVWWRVLPLPDGYAGAVARNGPDGEGWLGREIVMSWI